MALIKPYRAGNEATRYSLQEDLPTPTRRCWKGGQGQLGTNNARRNTVNKAEGDAKGAVRLRIGRAPAALSRGDDDRQTSRSGPLHQQQLPQPFIIISVFCCKIIANLGKAVELAFGLFVVQIHSRVPVRSSSVDDSSESVA